MKWLLFPIVFFLIMDLSVAQECTSNNCIAIKLAMKSKLFKGSFNCCLPERGEKVLLIVDTGNFFEDFKSVTICKRNVQISHQLEIEKSVNTIFAHQLSITFRHFVIYFYCPATGVHCEFIFKTGISKRRKTTTIKMISSSSGSY